MSVNLDTALKETFQDRWAGTRSARNLLGQAERALFALAHLTRGTDLEGHTTADNYELLKTINIDEIEPTAIKTATRNWRAASLSPATINKRLNCLSAMGISVKTMRVKEPKLLKWWLRPDEEARAHGWLKERNTPGSRMLSQFIAWTTRTGLRVEETLRLTRNDIDVEGSSMNVPGLKTSSSQATLPLGAEALKVAQQRMKRRSGTLLFPVRYHTLCREWDILRKAMKWPTAERVATLKALRRSAARYLHVDCNMPLDMVRQYLRHENIQTTMSYLRLTGGYGTEEMRRFLK